MSENCKTCDHKKENREGWWCYLWVKDPSTCDYHTGTLEERLSAEVQEASTGLREKLAIAEAALKPFAESYDRMRTNMNGELFRQDLTVHDIRDAHDAYNKLTENNERDE